MSLMDNVQQKTKHTFKLAQCLVAVLYISNWTVVLTKLNFLRWSYCRSLVGVTAVPDADYAEAAEQVALFLRQ